MDTIWKNEKKNFCQVHLLAIKTRQFGTPTKIIPYTRSNPTQKPINLGYEHPV